MLPPSAITKKSASSPRPNARVASAVTQVTPFTASCSSVSPAKWALPSARSSSFSTVNGLRDDAPVGSRWKKLAHRKIAEVENTIQRSLRLKALLKHLLHCRCASLQVCVQRLSLSPNLSRLTTKRSLFEADASSM